MPIKIKICPWDPGIFFYITRGATHDRKLCIQYNVAQHGSMTTYASNAWFVLKIKKGPSKEGTE